MAAASKTLVNTKARGRGGVRLSTERDTSIEILVCSDSWIEAMRILAAPN
jgi:hypothetical protein